MVTDKIKELEAAKAKLAQLEKSVAEGLRKELAGLPAAYGFDSVRSFFRAVTLASAGKNPRGAKRRKRSVITDATRAQVRKLVDAGKTGAQIAEEVGISLPSVQNIKKALGLVKTRK